MMMMIPQGMCGDTLISVAFDQFGMKKIAF